MLTGIKQVCFSNGKLWKVGLQIIPTYKDMIKLIPTYKDRIKIIPTKI